MKIYFAGSIRAGRDEAAVYEAMIAWLRSFGEVLTGHVGNPALSETDEAERIMGAFIGEVAERMKLPAPSASGYPAGPPGQE